MKSAALSLVLVVHAFAPVLGQQQPLTFSQNAGMILVQVKPGREGDFETGVAAMKRALSTDPSRQQQARGWTVYRALEGASDNSLYVFVMDPAIAGADYNMMTILMTGLKSDEAMKAARLVVESLAGSLNKLTLTVAQRMDSAVPTLPPTASTVAATQTIDAPPASLPTLDIRSKCTKEWPSDFSMQKYCGDQQDKALATLRARSVTTSDHRTIRTKCTTEWPDDYSMMNHCEEQQRKALAAIR